MSSALLDTHILLWILSKSKKLKKHPQLKKSFPWVVSPISLLEIKFLDECGRLQIDFLPLMEILKTDERFIIDDVGLEKICREAFSISWTRDPFDRFLVAHSMLRSLPFMTNDSLICQNYQNIV